MSVIRIGHTEELKGEVDIQGSKNAVLPMLAASILNKGCTVIKGCPDIADVNNTIRILEFVGCKTKVENSIIEIDANTLKENVIMDEYAGALRSSIIFLGAFLAREGEVEIAYPGGCSIGSRPLDIHLWALSKMNVNIIHKDDMIRATTTGLRGAHIKLKFPSVGATQNVLLCAVLAKGRTIIENYAKEPEIITLCQFLTGMGAKIRVSAKSIVVYGVESLHDSIFQLCGDRIVAGTYLFMTAMIGGCVTVNNVNSTHLTEALKKLVEIGCEIYICDNHIRIERAHDSTIKSLKIIETEPFPGFPTDLQAFMTTLMCVGDGYTVIRENIFENRFHTAKELVVMGADINFMSEKIICIKGVKSLKGKQVCASDLRDGAALIMAGLFADGETIVSNAQIIDRGYENIQRDLGLLDACIKLGDD